MAKKTRTNKPKQDEDADVKRLRAHLSAEEERLAITDDPVQRQTQARTVLMFFSELRKAEAVAAKRLERVTRAVIIAWGRAADPGERRSVARELATMDQEGSILA
jgi:hypothetical protein